MSQKTGIISDQRMQLHRSQKNHPETPLRLSNILQNLKLKKYLSHERVDYRPSFERLATDEELLSVYPQSYIDQIGSLWPKHSHRCDLTILDTYFGEHSERTARMSAGGVLEGIDKIMGGSWRNGFAIIRPPGHHSGGRSTVNGFCIFNNVAVGAGYIQKKYSVKKVLILDYDIHQGDGTFHIFNNDPSVLLISVHRHDRGAYYPSGAFANYTNVGSGEAEGTKLNIPLNVVSKEGEPYPFQPPGDNEYIYLYNRIIHPIIQSFNPEFILVSSGFDAARWDPVGGFSVTPNSYYYMTRKLMEFNKPLLCVLQGGYNLKQTSLALQAVVRALIGQTQLPQPIGKMKYEGLINHCHLEQPYHEDLEQVIEHHSNFWKVLKNQELSQLTNRIKENKEKVFGLVDAFEPQPTEQEKELAPKQEHIQSPTQFNFAAGHMQRFKNLSKKNDRILKWAYPQQRNFYQSNFPESGFAPRYYGYEGEYIVIENLLYQQRQPTILDIKVSRQSKNPENSAQKIAKEVKKEGLSTSQDYAFRIGGYSTPDFKEGVLLVKQQITKKILSKVVTTQNKQSFCTFLTDLASAIKKVRRHYYGTSVILVRGKDKSTIKWVDFHYWYDNCETYDLNLVEGLQKLEKFIMQIQPL